MWVWYYRWLHASYCHVEAVSLAVSDPGEWSPSDCDMMIPGTYAQMAADYD